MRCPACDLRMRTIAYISRRATAWLCPNCLGILQLCLNCGTCHGLHDMCPRTAKRLAHNWKRRRP